MPRHYLSLRAFSPIAKKKCARCKQPLPGRCMGLTYRGGRGNFMTEAFHPACAELEQPIVSRDEYAWWNSGELYELELAGDNARCKGSDTPIAPGELCFVRPRQDYGTAHRDVFGIEFGLGTSDFDWKNFEERLALAAQQHGPDRYRDALERVARGSHADRLRTIAATLAARRTQVYGLDRKGGKKQDLRWDLFFAAKVSAKTRTAAAADLDGAKTSWDLDRILTVSYADPTGKTTLKTFRDQIVSRLDALHAATPLHAAHFCGEGNLRESRAAVLDDLGKAPYPFVFVNHGRGSRSGTEWELLVQFASAPKPATRKRLEASFQDRSLRASWSGPWARLTGLHDGAYGHWLEAKLDPVLEAAGVEVAVLRGPALVGDGDAWHRWSEAQPARPSDAALTRLDFTSAEPDEAEIKRLVAEARKLYEADDAMDDPGMDVDNFESILARIPKRRPEHKQVKKMFDELLAMLAE